MESVADGAKAKVREWADKHRHVVLYDEPESTFLDVASGKRIKVSWRDLTGWEEKIHPETKAGYIVLLFEGGNQLALVDPGGTAFAPATENTGPVQNLPPVVCFSDFFTLKNRVDHYLYDHPEEPPPRECLDLVMICIATLDGARKVGFDVGDLEGDLEISLNEIERRKS